MQHPYASIVTDAVWAAPRPRSAAGAIPVCRSRPQRGEQS